VGTLASLLRHGRLPFRQSSRMPNHASSGLAPNPEAVAQAWQLGVQISGLVEEGRPAATLLSGDQLARRLGQGLDFEQLRAYQPGEPASLIDWRISARAQEPMVRVFREPAQRQCHFVIDTSASMQFGTRQQLKITQALTVAHLLCAAALRQGMSVALHAPALPRRSSDYPSTSRSTLMQHLATLAEWAESSDPLQTAGGDWIGFRQRLQGCLPDGQLIIVISDFLTDLVDEHGPLAWLPLAQHQHVLFIQIADPAEQQLPDVGSVVFAAQPPRQVDTHRSAERDRLARLFAVRHQELHDAAQAFGGWHALLFTDQSVAEITRLIAQAQSGMTADDPRA